MNNKKKIKFKKKSLNSEYQLDANKGECLLHV